MSDLELIKPSSQERSLVVSRQQAIAASLNETAKRLNFMNTTRRALYRTAGLRPRFRDKLFSIVLIASFVCNVILPCLAGIIYFGFLASAKYESETRFVVRSAIPAVGGGKARSDKGSPDLKLVQDTQVLTSYLTSPAIISQLDSEIDLLSVYGGSNIDYFSRLQNDATSEQTTDFWQEQIDSDIDPSSGIVTVKVRAFSPQDAYEVLASVVRIAETQVNALNSGIWGELRKSAEGEFASSLKELQETRLRVEEEQNRSGILNIEQVTDSKMEIIRNIQLEILELESRKKVNSGNISTTSPVMQELDRNIEVRRDQVRQMQLEIAGQNRVGLSGDNETLAGYSANVEKLNLEKRLAEERFEAAVKELDRVKLVSSLQLVYIDSFLPPTLPQESSNPRRLLMIVLTVLGSVALWLIFTGFLISARRRLD